MSNSSPPLASPDSAVQQVDRAELEHRRAAIVAGVAQWGVELDANLVDFDATPIEETLGTWRDDLREIAFLPG